MIIKCLMDNVALNETFLNEHGLSLYIETKNHKVLFDAGASPLFIENARNMQVDLSQVDYAFLSHGHYDHGGGLQAFLNINHQAPVFMQAKAAGAFYSRSITGDRKNYIGLDKALFPNSRFVMIEGNKVIDESLMVYSQVQDDPVPLPDLGLLKKEGDEYYPDDLTHEQNLIIKEEDKLILITGCAHKNIVNILKGFHAGQGVWPTHVFGGFHLFNPLKQEMLPASLVERITVILNDIPAQYYTGHCTGIEAYQLLKERMRDQVFYLSSGNCYEI